jgi:hypothetical protein
MPASLLLSAALSRGRSSLAEGQPTDAIKFGAGIIELRRGSIAYLQSAPARYR